MIDTLVLVVTPVLALFIRLDNSFAIAPYTQGLVLTTLVFVVAKLAVFYTFGFYKRYWRYAGIDELGYIGMLICVALILETFLLKAVFHLTGLPVYGLPRSLPLLDAILSFIIIGCIRF
ncbi:MAG: polysaccharide biosynthesis protein, partial [Microcoleus sp.]